ncbi:hypothetical protein O0235_13060 [Tepidiforma flava]|uniref:Uncharacterized protein n=1 Tax=Tepidiforma flava TaxID=3004094 RepID=A0ABY7M594_9CHLR|nr:hypothetical protein [Tepidiforma flava]WBL35693.1 hypothetical protein O0235_13060 [Tepidiforma flava]
MPSALQDIARPSLDDLQARAGEAAGGMPGTDGRYGMPGAETPSFGDALRAPGLNLIGGAVADLDAAIAGTAPGTGLPGGGSPGHGNKAYQGMVESAMAAMTGGTGSDPFAVTSGRGAMSGSGELGLMQGALDTFSQSLVGPSVENDGDGQGGIELLKRAIAEAEAEARAKAPDTGDSSASGRASQPGQAGQATNSGNAGAAAVPGQAPSQATEGGKAAGEGGLLTEALNWMSYKLYNRPFFGIPGKLPIVFTGNVNEAEQLREVDDNIGSFGSNQPLGKVSKEADVPNLETALFKTFGKAKKKQEAEGQTTPPDAKQPIDETPDNPALRAWIYEHHKDQIDAMRAGRHGWDVDPADGASDAPPAGNLSLAETAALQRGMTNFLIGNPGDPGVRGGTGGGSVSFGVLPGDRGNIDYGPDAAGQWTGSARTEDPADALSGFGGSGLSIADAHGTADAAQSASSSASDDDSDSADTV